MPGIVVFRDRCGVAVANLTYKAKDIQGKQHTGVIEAENIQAAAEMLRQRGLFVIDIRPEKTGWFFNLSLARRIGRKDLAVFCRQFSTMINAGLPMLSSLNILRQQLDNKRMTGTVEELMRSLEQGNTLAQSMEESGRFPEMMVYMVEAGEVGGVLDDVLLRLAEHFEKEHEILEKVKSAMTYPAVVLGVAICAVIFMLIFVLPSFSGMLTSFQVPLPLPTRIVLAASQVLTGYWYLLLLGLGGFLFLAHRYFRTEAGREKFDRLVLKTPIFGDLLVKIIVARFTRTLGTLLRGGVPILQALEVVKKTTDNRVVAKMITRAQENIRNGQGMADVLGAEGVFPPMVVEMISVGEQTGVLDNLLVKMSQFYDQEVDNITGRLSTMLEPILIVFMGGIVGFIIISLLLPMFTLLGAM